MRRIRRDSPSYVESSLRQTPIQRAAGTFYGASLGAMEVAGLGLALNAYPPDFQTPPHTHADAFLYLVVDGACLESYGRRSRSVGPSALVFHPAGEPHATHWPGPGGRCFHVEFRSEWATRLHGQTAILETPADFRGGTPVRLARRLFQEFRQRDALSPLVIEGLTLELVAAASRPGTVRTTGKPPLWFARAKEMLRSRFAERLSLSAVAAEVGVHPVHLATVFRRHQGCTVGEYLRRCRVEFASCQLRTSSVPLIEVALAAGFADQAHFSRTFKRLTGMTPAEYRRAHLSSP